MAESKRESAGIKRNHYKGFPARAFAVKALSDILDSGANLDDALGPVRNSDLAGNDKSFTHAIVATSLRRKGQIENVLQQFMKKPLPAKSGLAGHNLIAAAAQILFMGTPPHAAIDLAVHLARKDRIARHFAGLTNAVLRRVADKGPEIVAGQDEVRLNIPPWMLKSWRRAYGADTAARIGAELLTEASLDISPKADAAHWAQTLDGVLLDSGSIRLDRPVKQISSLPGYAEGAWWVQDAAAALPVKLMGDVRGLRVLDLCAAPGGKTAQLVAAGADVTAVDNSAERLDRLADNLDRLKLKAQPILADATTFSSEKPFDIVIADVPCSSTGTLRRHPDGLHIKTKDLPAKLHLVQKAILSNAISLTRSGGRLVYCTCSLEVQEGEELIGNFLADDHGVSRMPLTKDEVFGNAQLINEQGDLRVLPCHSIGTVRGLDGFFASRLAKL